MAFLICYWANYTQWKRSYPEVRKRCGRWPGFEVFVCHQKYKNGRI